MTFAWPLPWWLIAAWIMAAVVVAVVAYVRAVPPLSRAQRVGLVALRTTALILLLVFILRPVIARPEPPGTGRRVAVLVDTSRSMGLPDGRGVTRSAAAQALVRQTLLPALRGRYDVELLGFDRTVTRRSLDELTTTGPLTDLVGATRLVRTRTGDDEPVAIVVVSDGGQTGEPQMSRLAAPGAPVFAVPLGATRVERDREVTAVSVGEARVEGSIVELSATVVSHGFGTTPVAVRVLENGRPIQVRRVAPPGDGAPTTERFRVSPPRDRPTVYTVEVPTAEGEITNANNRRSVLVPPAGRRRQVLLVEGAPGFEHTFLKRAWARDPGLELDSVVQKGRDDSGAATYYVQAAAPRAAMLRSGYPASREALFAYDVVVLANMTASQLTRAQAEWTAAFVEERGGGLLVLGARTFAAAGLRGTPIEAVLPVDFTGRIASDGETSTPRRGGRILLTRAGERHPITQLGGSGEASQRLWTELPPLPATSAMGQPRPGAQVLALAEGAGGDERPLVAVQHYGRGRTLVFGGEASWRWRMQLPSSNNVYETFWRQAGRWLATAAPDPVSVKVTAVPPGVAAPLMVQVFDAEFKAVADAAVRVQVTDPEGQSRELRAVPATGAGSTGVYIATFTPPTSGTYDVRVEAARGSASSREKAAGHDAERRSAPRADQPTIRRTRVVMRDPGADDETTGAELGASREWWLVGGADPEMADPRRNDAALERLAEATGGRLLAARELAQLPALIAARTSSPRVWVQRELWHNPWTFLLVAAMLCTEWALRRRWGLR
ncbi:MAG: hypothetical protein GEU99_00570 [Luteitalea sp.]|nr:hypothetical protein [Luteitalea sp.]